MPEHRGDRDKKTGRFMPGNQSQRRHGGYSMVSTGTPPAIRRQVQAIRDRLILDIAGEEEALTAAQAILIDKTVNLYQVTLCLEAYIRANGAFRGKKLDPVLGQNYITYVNTIRLNLRELGISTKAGDRLLGPLEIAAEIDAEKAQAVQEAAEAAEKAPATVKSGPGRTLAGKAQGGEPVSVDIDEGRKHE